MLPLVLQTSSYSYEFDGRIEVSVRRSMDSMAGEFSIEMAMDADMAQSYLMPDIRMGREVVVWLDGKVALTGYVDKREGSGDAESYRLTITGRSKTSKLVDSSAVHKTGQIDRKTPNEIIRELVQPYGITLRDDKRVNEVLKRFIIRDGETVERAIRRAGREHGLVPFDDEHGNLVIQEPGARGRGGDLVVGENILSWTVAQDLKVRHSRVVVKGQAITDDSTYGRAASEIQAAVEDGFVKIERPLVIPYWGDATRDRVRRRARIEALRRQGESINVSVEVPGFTDAGTGGLYAPNVRHRVVITVDGVDNELVVKSVEFRLSPEEARTSLELVHENAFSDGGDGGKAGGKKSKGGKLANKRGRKGGKSSSGGQAAGADDDSRIWIDAFEKVKDVEIG